MKNPQPFDVVLGFFMKGDNVVEKLEIINNWVTFEVSEGNAGLLTFNRSRMSFNANFKDNQYFYVDKY